MANENHRPFLKRDADNQPMQNSYADLAFRGEYTGSNLIYKGLARPGASESEPVWQIALMAYDGSGNLTSITWPQNSSGAVSSDYEFIWANRATYTYV